MEQLVHQWAAINGVCFVSKSRPERYELVRGFTGRLATALRAEPFDPAAGYEVGPALVGADYVVPEVLARTVNCSPPAPPHRQLRPLRPAPSRPRTGLDPARPPGPVAGHHRRGLRLAAGH